MADAEKIREEGVKLLKEFSETLEGLPDTEETHYVVGLKNVWRPDADPANCSGFKDKFLKLAPQSGEGYVITEKSE